MSQGLLEGVLSVTLSPVTFLGQLCVPQPVLAPSGLCSSLSLLLWHVRQPGRAPWSCWGGRGDCPHLHVAPQEVAALGRSSGAAAWAEGSVLPQSPARGAGSAAHSCPALRSRGHPRGDRGMQ